MTVRVPVCHESDVFIAAERAREIGRLEGLSEPAAAALATAVTEIARNIVVYARCGEVLIQRAEGWGRRGVVVVARDEGPGIADPGAALQDHVSTNGTLGLGLPSARRLVDELELASAPGQGTTVTLKKWVPEPERDR